MCPGLPVASAAPSQEGSARKKNIDRRQGSQEATVASFYGTDGAWYCQDSSVLQQYVECVSFIGGRKATSLSGIGISCPAGIAHSYMT